MQYLTPQEWLTVMQNEYLRGFIGDGGAAVKFAVAMDATVRSQLEESFRSLAQEEGFQVVCLDSRSTKLHLIDHVFTGVARQIDWRALCNSFLQGLLREKGYKLPPEGAELTFESIAIANLREEMFLRKEVYTWLEEKIFRDFRMTQEFRIAMIQLCRARLESKGVANTISECIEGWLKGELKSVAPLKDFLIYQKIARHNARQLLLSLARWFRLSGKKGLVVICDISQYLSMKGDIKEMDLRYSVSTTLDLYEVLRQFVDGTDQAEGCLFVVLAPPGFLTDEKRRLERYDALFMRVTDEVRDIERENPCAPLVRIGAQRTTSINKLVEELS